MMKQEYMEIRSGGKTMSVPAIAVKDKPVIVTGKSTKFAAVHDEDFLEGQPVDDPEFFVAKIREKGLKADIFTFTQKLPETTPLHRYFFEYDNVAAIPITTFADWWNNRVSTDLRKDVRRAEKRGVTVRTVEFSDEFVRGIMDIYNETPFRQGRAFWHYGKDFGTIKNETATFPDQSQFLGAYLNNELIGFLKIVHVGRLACLLHIISKNAHNDKRPANALIAKAVELCHQQGSTYLTYGKYVYGNGSGNSLTEFKHRNGFEKILVPRYYIPLTLKGKLILRMKLHHGIRGVLPEKALKMLKDLRSRYHLKFAAMLHVDFHRKADGPKSLQAGREQRN